MAYPSVPAPYGLKPINLIGGQVFAGSTRNLPIPYGYGTNIFYGDYVQLTRGFINRISVTSGSSTTFPVGIFLGCSYTDPVTKQKRFSQYWPASTLSGDAVAIVSDDPDAVFKAAMCSSGTTMSSAALALVGQNASMLNNTGSTTTGDSANAVVSPTSTPATTLTLPIRIVGLVPETAFATTATGSSSTTTITLTGSGLPAAITIGTDVAYLASNGQVIETGSFVTAAATAGATSVTINQQPIVLGSGTDIPAASTIIFTQYPEVLVKINFAQHTYYAGLGVA